MHKPHVVRQGTEQGPTLADGYGNDGDGQLVDQSRPQEALNRPAAVDVQVLGTLAGKPMNTQFVTAGFLAL